MSLGLGGASCCCEGRVGLGAHPFPLLGQAAVGVRCPLAVGAGLRVWGPGTGPLACATRGVSRAAGLAGGCPWGVPLTVVRGV